ncbi:nuclear transport factor 2 family protein [Lysobacter terrae]
MRRGRWLLALVLPALLGACEHFPLPTGSTDPEIRRQRQQFDQTFAYRRMGELANVVTDDIQLTTPSRVTTGKKNLVRYHEALVQKHPDVVLAFTTERVERNPRWKFAAESGHWTESWQEDGESVEIRGSYYALWKFQSGRWRLQSQTMAPVSCKGPKYCQTME